MTPLVRAAATVVALLAGVVMATAVDGGAGAAVAVPGTDCPAPVDTTVTDVSWPLLRLAPQLAWPSGRGRGVTIGAIGSGVDAAAPALAGRVAVGADITTGKGFANTDCLGDGTAMAGVAVAQSRPGSGLVGIAPDATVLPIRVDPDGPRRSAQLAVALQVAVSAGASVVMIAGTVDLSTPDVAQAVRATIARDVVVVVAADGLVGGDRQPGLLRVGAVDAANRIVGELPPGAVDVVAPGATVVTVSANGAGEVVRSGSDLAVAFVAGLVAVVRSATVGLSATATTGQIERTADQFGDPPPDPVTGWGLINPGRAVQIDPEPTGPDVGAGAAGAGDPGWGGVVIGLAGLALAGTLLAVAGQGRAADRRAPPQPASDR